MTHVSEILPTPLLTEMIQDGYVNVNEHTSGDYLIHNYSQKAAIEREWNAATLTCRGLVTDTDGTVLARPFAKFFNLEDDPSSPVLNRPYTVHEKMDGSLGILWKDHSGGLNVATRGSFHSEQAAWATDWVRQMVDGHNVPNDRTMLFEIIYPENRIVVDYKGRSGLVYLDCIHIESGRDSVPPPWVGDVFVQAKEYGIADSSPHELKARMIERGIQDDGNTEGFVLKFYMDDGHSHRVKVKLDEYVRLHALVTQTSTKIVWRHLRDDLPMDELLDRVPDEFYEWLRATIRELTDDYNRIYTTASADLKEVVREHGDDRKQIALAIRDHPYKGIMFRMLDEKDYNESIWRIVEPPFDKPFSQQ